MDVEETEDKILNEEYKIWKKNTPFLYDIVMTHSLEWPTLTVEWMKLENSKSKDPYLSTQKLVLGTHTSNDCQNYLMVAEVQLPCDKKKKNEKVHRSSEHAYSGVLNKIDIKQKINHDGEVHRARIMPQNNSIIATKSATKTAFVYDTSKHPAIPVDNVNRPEHRLHGHSLEGYGLAWNPHTEGLLLSGSDDSHICIWDINGAPLDVDAVQVRQGHSSVVEDVAWSHFHPSLFGSCGDEAQLFLWDARDNYLKPTASNNTGHKSDINCLSFNPFNEFLLATGSSDKTVALWDCRKLEQPLHYFAGHSSGVFQINWSPFSENILSSCGSDRRLYVWDRSLIGQPQSPEDAKEGVPELLFIHGGHSAKISDFSWNANAGHEWLMSSVSEDNILQVWQMADCIHAGCTYSAKQTKVKEEEDEEPSSSKRAKR